MPKRGSTIVALCGTNSAQDASINPRRQWDRILLPDLSRPDRSCLKNYWKSGPCIYELQGVDRGDEFASFLVNGTIIPNGQLHTLTPVDPLFFVLARMDQPTSWKPLDQVFHEVLDDLNAKARDALLASIDATSTLSEGRTKTHQYCHILESLELSETEFVYKLSPTKVFAWLKRKTQAAEAILRQQEERNKSNDQSSFAKGFVLGGHEQMTSSDPPARTSRAHEESIQIICQYLLPSWRDRFLNHLNVSAKDVLEEDKKDISKKVKSTTDWNAGLTASETATEKEANAKKKTITAGAKQLQKVNTKGMSKLSSFFQPKQKK